MIFIEFIMVLIVCLMNNFKEPDKVNKLIQGLIEDSNNGCYTDQSQACEDWVRSAWETYVCECVCVYLHVWNMKVSEWVSEWQKEQQIENLCVSGYVLEKREESQKICDRIKPFTFTTKLYLHFTQVFSFFGNLIFIPKPNTRSHTQWKTHLGEL